MFRFSLCFYKVARLSSERIRDTIYQFLRWWKFSPLDHWIFALRRPVSLFPKSSLFLEQLSKNRGGNVRAKISIPSLHRFRINCKAKTRPIKIEKFKKIILKDKKSWQEGWCDACNPSQRFLIDSSCIRFIFPSYILEYPTKVNAIERNKAFWSTAFTFHNSLVDSLAEWPIFTRLESSTSGLSTARYQ